MAKKSYDKKDEILRCAEFSDIAYELPYKIWSILNAYTDVEQVNFRTIKRGNFRVVVVSTSDIIYVVFRGTVINSGRSILTDFKTLRTRWLKGKVHSGFLGLLIKAKPFYKSMLRRPENLDKGVVFVGHSQGGAVAFLAAMDNSFPKNVISRLGRSYTYGQPRTGNKEFCRNAESRLGDECTRIANGRDIVVGLPFKWQGYDHIRDYFHVSSKTGYARYRRDSRAWPLFSSSIRDHFMKNYIKAVSRLESNI